MTMDDLTQTFAIGLARTGRADVDGAIDRALKRSGLTGRQTNALVKLREKAVCDLDRIAEGRDPRLPAAVVAKVVEGIQAVLSPDEKRAIAKGAPGKKLEGEELVLAAIAVAKEFRELAEQARKACKKLGAEEAFDRWEKRFHKRISEALHKMDLQLAEIEMAEARSALNALIDGARIDEVLGEIELPTDRHGR
jgi:hypothetical protein